MSIPATLKPTVKDFVDLFGSDEASELTAMQDPLLQGYIPEKIEKAIDYAWCIVESHDAKSANLCTKYAIRKAADWLTLDIARYRLDGYRPSENVQKRYDDAIEYMRTCLEERDQYCVLTDDEKEDLGLDTINYNRIIGCDSEERVYTRDKSIATWRRDRRWRFNSRDNVQDGRRIF